MAVQYAVLRGDGILGELSWQKVALILSSILLVGGIITYSSLFGSLFQLKGINYTASGDVYCDTTCESYINVTTSYWSVCFGYFNNTKYQNETLFKKVALSRTLWVNLNNVKNVISTNPEVPVDWLVPAINGWRIIKDGDCWNRKKVNKIKIVGHKEKSETIKWGLSMGEYISLDPLWIGIPDETTPINETPSYNLTHKYIYSNESKTWIIVPKKDKGGGETPVIPVEPIEEKQLIDTQTFTSSFSEPAYNDLHLSRIGDKLNITFGNEYATIRGYFWYQNSTYSFAQAASYGVTYDSWVNYNTGVISKFGGMINVSNVNPIMKSNGYFIVFELVDKSEGLTYRREGDSIYLNDNVRIVWKDYENLNNKFEIYNSTIVYLTDNGEKFHDTLIYDPQVFIGNISLGVHNKTFKNATGIYSNLSLGNGTYTSQVFSINTSLAPNMLNLTVNSLSAAGYEIEGKIRASNNSYFINAVGWYSFTDGYNEVTTKFGVNSTGASYVSANCKLGGCLSIQGNNDYFRDTNLSIDLTKNLSIEFWMNRTDQNDYDRIMNYYVDATHYFVVAYYSNDVTLELRNAGTSYVNNASSNNLFTQNVWHHIVIVYENLGTTPLGTVKVYVDGIIGTMVPDPGYSVGTTTGLVVGLKNDLAGSEIDGFIDELRFYNRILSSGEINDTYINYTKGLGVYSSYQSFSSGVDTNNYSIDNTSSFFQTQFKINNDGISSSILYGFNGTLFVQEAGGGEEEDIIPPNVTFNTQIPSDLTSNNTFGVKMNITYNITDINLNISTIKLFIKINSTTRDPIIFVNGTSFSGYASRDYVSNITSTFLFQLDDNEVYPATYNMLEDTFYKNNATKETLTASSQFISIELINITNSTAYNFFEIMSNSTGIQRVYYCNSTFGFTNSPVGNSNCFNIYNIPANNPFSHIHSTNSSHQVVPLTINTTTGKVGTVKVTEKSYFMIRGTNAVNPIEYYYLPNLTRNGAIKTTVNNGIAWTNQTYTINAHLHQYNGADSFWYYACANDTTNNQNCTTPRQDLINLSGLPPSAPYVFMPINDYYSGDININYTASESPNGYAILFYNLSLNNIDYTFNKTIYTNNSLNLSYIWNSTGTTDGIYIVGVKACDSLTQCSLGYSENFTIDTTPPSFSNNQTNASSTTYNGTTIQINITATDASGISACILAWNDTSSEWCYQETANVSTSCGGLNTGKYTITDTWTNNSNLIDGDWDTNASGNGVYYYVNYTKPVGASSSSLWQIKDDTGTRNLTFDLTDCWNYYPDKLRLRVSATSGSGVTWWCKGSVWSGFEDVLGTGDVYEEAMWWNITSGFQNQTTIYSGTPIWNESIEYIPSTGGTIGWKAQCNDTLGNTNVSNIYTFYVNPIITPSGGCNCSFPNSYTVDKLMNASCYCNVTSKSWCRYLNFTVDLGWMNVTNELNITGVYNLSLGKVIWMGNRSGRLNRVTI